MDTENKVGQRGPDKQPREFNPKSMLNLKQYQISDIPTKKTWNYLIIACFIALLGVIIWKFHKSKDSNAPFCTKTLPKLEL